jgi:hypothetical protein
MYSAKYCMINISIVDTLLPILVYTSILIIRNSKHRILRLKRGCKCFTDTLKKCNSNVIFAGTKKAGQIARL